MNIRTYLLCLLADAAETVMEWADRKINRAKRRTPEPGVQSVNNSGRTNHWRRK